MYRDSRPPSKLHTKWQGPLRIVKFSGNIYTLQDLVNMKLYDYHIKQIRPFKYDQMEVDPVDVARKDKGEFLVDEILNHRLITKGSKRRKDYEFLVSWVGYGPEDNLWTKWKDIRETAKLSKYLFTHGFKRFMTKEEKAQVRKELQED
jgi:hypothetical protein